MITIKCPSRKDIEDKAQEIVITIRKEPERDPYELMRGTGWGPNILDTLLKKFNISNFLNDFDNFKGDPHDRNIEIEPLSLEKLLGNSDCGTTVQRIDEPGIKGLVIRSQRSFPPKIAMDLQDVIDMNDLHWMPPVVQSKIAMALPPARDPIYYQTNTKLAAAKEAIEDDIFEATHSYRGTLNELAEAIKVSSEIRDELAHCHRRRIPTKDCFKTAGVQMPEDRNIKWRVPKYPKLGELLDDMEVDLAKIAELQAAKEVVVDEMIRRQREEW